MKQLMFSVDLSRCIDCKTCEMACNEHYGLTGPHRRSVVTYQTQENTPVHLSISCNHCANPICVTVCPENNFHKRSDGIVVHSSNNCLGCRRCIDGCPFNAPKLNQHTKRADKCNLCVDRIDQGKNPICVDKCITGSLKVVPVVKDKIDLNKHTFKEVEVPIATHTNPSIFIIKKQKGYTFFR